MGAVNNSGENWQEIPVINGRIYPLPNGDRYIECKPVRSEKFYRRKNQEVVDLLYKLLIAYKSSFDNAPANSCICLDIFALIFVAAIASKALLMYLLLKFLK